VHLDPTAAAAFGEAVERRASQHADGVDLVAHVDGDAGEILPQKRGLGRDPGDDHGAPVGAVVPRQEVPGEAIGQGEVVVFIGDQPSAGRSAAAAR
jgi:hypothetical protein